MEALDTPRAARATSVTSKVEFSVHAKSLAEAERKAVRLLDGYYGEQDYRFSTYAEGQVVSSMNGATEVVHFNVWVNGWLEE